MSGENDNTPPEGYISQEDHEATVTELKGKLESATRPTGMVDEKGNFTEGWATQIGLEATDPLAQKFTNVGSLAKSYKTLESMQGANVVKVPGEHSSEGDVALFRERMGIPSSADDYLYEKPASMPEGLEFDESRLKSFQTVAHEIGLTGDQFKKLVQADIEWHGKDIAASQDAFKAFQAEESRKAEEELGEGGIKMYQKMANWLNEKLTTDPDNPVDVMADPAFSNSAFAMKVLATIGEAFGEDKLPKLDSEISNASAKEQAKDIMDNPNNPLHQLYWNGDQKTVDKVQYLTRLSMRGSST
jgi:hypothetical protein